ncbi:MAG: 50S ribosomal protein L6 [bacterium]
MSRIGRSVIHLPDSVKVSIAGNTVRVAGRLGETAAQLSPRVAVTLDGKTLRVERKSDGCDDRALHGLARTLVANMVRGVTEGYEKTLEVHGTGYKVEKKKDSIVLQLGFAHPVEFPIPGDIAIDVDRNVIKVRGIDSERVGTVSASIRSLKPPDPYKGKGIRCQGERIKLKPGKSGV